MSSSKVVGVTGFPFTETIVSPSSTTVRSGDVGLRRDVTPRRGRDDVEAAQHVLGARLFKKRSSARRNPRPRGALRINGRVPPSLRRSRRSRAGAAALGIFSSAKDMVAGFVGGNRDHSEIGGSHSGSGLRSYS